MDTKLGILSAAAFAGVVLGGALIARPGLASSLNPASLWQTSSSAAAGNGSGDSSQAGEAEAGFESEDHEAGEHGLPSGIRFHSEGQRTGANRSSDSQPRRDSEHDEGDD